MTSVFQQPILNWSDGIPTPQGMNWDDEFKNYIYYLIYNVIYIQGNDTKTINIIQMMLSPENMQIWKKSITHKSYNKDFNYESLKYIGDKELDTALSRWLMKKNPNFNEHQLTKYNHTYMNTTFQPLLTELYKLDKWVLASEITPKIMKELFESYNGALEVISRNVYNNYISKGEYEMAIYINPGDIVTKNLNFVFQYINLQEF